LRKAVGDHSPAAPLRTVIQRSDAHDSPEAIGKRRRGVAKPPAAASRRHHKEEDYMSHRRTTVTGAIGALLSVLALSLASCAQPLTTREKGTLAGGTLGAATGAIIGAATGSPAAGAAIG